VSAGCIPGWGSGERATDGPAAAPLDRTPRFPEAESTGPQIAAKFIADLFGDVSEAPVFLCSLGNERNGEHAPRQTSTRESDIVAKFLTKWDQPGRGLFFCVGTVNGDRKKDNVVETIGLHADIDLKDVDNSIDDIERILKGLKCPPSYIVRSGNGVHGYWPFKEAIKGEAGRVEAALRQLADIVGGDLQVCEIARLMSTARISQLETRRADSGHHHPSGRPSLRTRRPRRVVGGDVAKDPAEGSRTRSHYRCDEARRGLFRRVRASWIQAADRCRKATRVHDVHGFE
jgi:hypothetical protein